ncbi:TetR/AcrR family transcriptional regulator [Novosphingobium sp.]|uniref:TetR/AcrR family transcriptional regulator n=1 Tax=Novosphingobium sp. TaxID=1874826 RepID=UPI0025E62479|nr:TetR/AcrR family transcriptional regulator [Novosphingobium sp.]
MRYDSEHKARTRNRVLKEAAAALRAVGPDRLAVADVMNRAGLTHGGFYGHFKSRDELLTEAVGAMFQDRYELYFSHIETVEPRAGLQRFVDNYLSIRHRDARDTGCPIPILAGELHRLPEAARSRFDVAVHRLTDGLVTLLGRAAIDAPRTRAVSAIAEMVGAIAVARTLPDITEATELLETAKVSVEAKLGLR